MKIIKKITTAKKLILNYFFYTARPKYINPIWFLRKYFEYDAEKNLRK